MSAREALPGPLRLILFLLPRAFRGDFGSEVGELMLERFRERRAAGYWTVIGVAARDSLDLCATAARLRFGAGTRGGAELGSPAAGARRPRAPRAPLDPSPVRFHDMLMHDIRSAVRSLAYRPGFTASIALTLALGIGTNAMMYSAVDAVVLNPYDFPEPDRVVGIGVEIPALGQPLGFVEALSAPEYADIAAQSRTLEAIVAFDLGNRQIMGTDAPENVFAGFWWGDPLRALGMSPQVGRGFSEQEVAEGEPVALISHRLWQSRFAADEDAVGSTIRIDGNPYTLIGVAPPGVLLYGTDLWMPMWAAPELLPRGRRQFNIIARIREDADITGVNAELEAIARRAEQEYSGEYPEYRDWKLRALTWADVNVRNLKPAAVILLGAVGFVLLLVCANIASLLLSRSVERGREMALRTALGAGRSRIARQLMTESLIIAVLGGAAGLLLAAGGLQLLVAQLPQNLLPTPTLPSVNPRVLGFTAAIAIVSGVMFGIAPAWQLSGTAPQRSLGPGSAGSTSSRSQRRFHSTFVAVEVALALVLLAGAGLFINSMWRLQSVDPGMRTDGVLTMRLTLPWQKYEGEAITEFFVDLARRVEALPGVESAASGSQFAPATFLSSQFTLPDSTSETDTLPSALMTVASDGFFETLGISLQRGRAFTALDLPGSGFVTVVNQEFARRYLGGEDRAVGQRFKLGPIDDPRPWLDVVGVVADTKNRALEAPTAPELFVSLRQVNGIFNQLFLLVRTEGDPMATLPGIRETVSAMDPDQPVYAIRTLEQAFDSSFATQEFATRLLTVFAALAVTLAAIGIFGVVSYAASQRSREIGVRVALGAGGREVRRLVIRQAMTPIVIGTLAGLGLALALGRAVDELLYEVGGTDPATLGVVAALLATVAFVASYLPALRASAVDPITALRTD